MVTNMVLLVEPSLSSKTSLSCTMPPEGDNTQSLDCPHCLQHINIGTGGLKNLQQHQNGMECCKEQQHLKQRQKLAAQQMLLSAFVVARLCPSHTSPMYAIMAPQPLQPALPLIPMMSMSETFHLPESGGDQKESHHQPVLPSTSITSTHIPKRDNSEIATDGHQIDMDRLSPLEKAWALAKSLPKSVPEAIEGDEIWEIGHIDPKAFVATNCTEDRLEDWENIDPMFNRLLGYGVTQGEIAMKVCHGEGGVEGIVNFL